MTKEKIEVLHNNVNSLKEQREFESLEQLLSIIKNVRRYTTLEIPIQNSLASIEVRIEKILVYNKYFIDKLEEYCKEDFIDIHLTKKHRVGMIVDKETMRIKEMSKINFTGTIQVLETQLEEIFEFWADGNRDLEEVEKILQKLVVKAIEDTIHPLFEGSHHLDREFTNAEVSVMLVTLFDEALTYALQNHFDKLHSELDG